MEKIKYYNIFFNNIDSNETLGICADIINSAKNSLIFFINAHCFNIAQKDKTYLQALNDADILLNDGIGFKLGAMTAGIRIKENMNGTDFVPKLLSLARDMKMNIYLLGGEEGIALKAKQNLESRLPGINIVGAGNGYFNFDDDKAIVADIIEKNTDILIVGMGVPRQELWLTKNKENLTGVRISVAAGAILDFISGNVHRAPLWMRKSGIEWMYRLYQEPKRLFKRYFIGIPEFFLNLAKTK